MMRAACASSGEFKIVWNSDTYTLPEDETAAVGSAIQLLTENTSALPLFYGISQNSQEGYGTTAAKAISGVPSSNNNKNKKRIVTVAIIVAVVVAVLAGFAFMLLLSRRPRNPK